MALFGALRPMLHNGQIKGKSRHNIGMGLPTANQHINAERTRQMGRWGPDCRPERQGESSYGRATQMVLALAIGLQSTPSLWEATQNVGERMLDTTKLAAKKQIAEHMSWRMWLLEY